MTIFLSILGVIALIVLVFITIGILTPRKYTGSVTAGFKLPAGEVFRVLSDIEGLPSRRKEIEKVEMLLPSEEGQRRWREIAAMGGFAEFETVQEIQDKYIEVRLVRSSFGITGTWKYELNEKDGNTELRISELSRTDKLVTRGMLALAGRNATLRQEIKNLRTILQA